MPVSTGKATALTEVHKAMAAPTEPVTRVKRSGRPGLLCGIFMETSTVFIVVTDAVHREWALIVGFARGWTPKYVRADRV
ncbi:hypothetical protein D3C78_1150600 [compost metagenome]